MVLNKWQTLIIRSINSVLLQHLTETPVLDDVLVDLGDDAGGVTSELEDKALVVKVEEDALSRSQMNILRDAVINYNRILQILSLNHDKDLWPHVRTRAQNFEFVRLDAPVTTNLDSVSTED